MQKNFIPGITPGKNFNKSGWYFAFADDKLLVNKNGSDLQIPFIADVKELGKTEIRRQYLGTYDNNYCYSVEMSVDAKPPPKMVYLGLRQLYGILDDDLFAIAGRALQIVNWDKTHQYCGQCGGKTIGKKEERVKECPDCGLISYPRLAPAIIVCVEKDDEILLARSKHFPKSMYSVIAGFVEPGESLEDAVVREIKEEVGIQVRNIRYFASQPWPFPNSLMIGFTAVYLSGKIKIDSSEIEDAAWYRVEYLPKIPGKISIARHLIEWFIKRH